MTQAELQSALRDKGDIAMRTIRSFSAWLFLACALGMAGCASTGGVQVDDPADGVAVAYAGIRAAADTTTQLVRSGALDATRGRQVQEILERAYALAAIAEAAVGAGKPADAWQTLALVNGVLVEVQHYLTEAKK
jgi:uncharacterized protein YceK